MRKLSMVALALVCTAMCAAAQTRIYPSSINIRYSEQISNGPAGSCGCFALEGAAGDLSWQAYRFGKAQSKVLSGVADVSVEHAGSVSGAPYGLTLTTFAFGPRFAFTAPRKSEIFAQTLFGVTHGSNSQFPVGNMMEMSANSFALDLGGGFEHAFTQRIAARFIQVEYLRTSLPNNSSNWQNSLRLSAGVTFRFH